MFAVGIRHVSSISLERLHYRTVPQSKEAPAEGSVVRAVAPGGFVVFGFAPLFELAFAKVVCVPV